MSRARPRLRLLPLAALLVLSSVAGLLAACGGFDDPVLQSIEVTPTSSRVAAGTRTGVAATAIYSDGTHANITGEVAWSSSRPTIATVGGSGAVFTVSAVAAGTTVLSASLQGVTGQSPLTVTAAVLQSIEVTPAMRTAAKGSTLQLTATGVFSDRSTQDLTQQVTWSSSNLLAATVSNRSGSAGLAAATGVGSASLRASSGAIVGSTTLTVTAATLVSIQVTPAHPTLPSGLTAQLSAMGTYSDQSTQDLTTQVVWFSSNAVAATVSNAAAANGLVSSRSAGTTTITAASGSVSGSTVLTVSAATLVSIQVTPASPSMPKGLTAQLTAIGMYTDNSTQNLTTQVTWSSSNGAIATVSNAAGSNGQVAGMGVGSATLTAVSGAVSGTAALSVTAATLVSIEVTPASPLVPEGLTDQLAATGIYSDNSTQNLTDQVTWASSDPAVATVSNAAGSDGLTTSDAVGTATIAATSGGISGSVTLAFTAATLVSIQVTPTNPSMANGTAIALTATGIYTDNSIQNLTAQVTWSSANASVAVVSNASGSNGMASSAGVGTTTVTAASGSVSGNTTLTVTAATLVSIQITPTNPSMANGTALALTATGIYTDNSTQNLTAQVTWSSANASVAVVSNASGSNGLASSAGVGTTTVTAASGNVSGSATLAVTAATLVSIEVTPANVSVNDSETTALTATGLFTDNSSQDVTGQVTWSSADSAIATVSNAAGSNGVVTGTGGGSTLITASSGAISNSATVTVLTKAAL